MLPLISTSIPGALLAALLGAGPGQKPQSPALQALAQTRTAYFKALVELTGGRFFVLPPPEAKAREQWVARLRGIRRSYLTRLEEIIGAHPGDPGLAKVRLCAAREHLRSHRRPAAERLALALTAAGLDPEERLAGGRLLAALGRGKRAAELCRTLAPDRLEGPRRRLALAGVLAAGGMKEGADRIVATHFARAGEAEAFRSALEGMERLAAGLRPALERALLARAYTLEATRFPDHPHSRARSARIPGLELGPGDPLPPLAGKSLGKGATAASGSGRGLVLFWRRGERAREEVARLHRLACTYGSTKIWTLGVCLDREQEEAARWLLGIGLPLEPHLAAPAGLTSPPALACGVTRTPFYLVLDERGRIAALAPTGWAVEHMLEDLAKKPPPSFGGKDPIEPEKTERNRP